MTAPFERHRPDITALTFGVAFATIGLAALAQQVHWVHLQGRTWFGVVTLALGLAGAVGVVAATLRRRTPAPGPR